MSCKNKSAYGIITGGLGLPACKGMIVNQFKVGLCSIEVIVEPGGFGGSHPLAPGEFFDRYRVTQPDDTTNFIKNHNNITITLHLNEKKIVQNYRVSPNIGTAIIKSLKAITLLQDKIKVNIKNIINNKFVNVAVTNIKSGYEHLKVSIKNINTPKD